MPQIVFHSAHTSIDAHSVVVENDEHVVWCRRNVVESFKSESATHCSVAYYSNYVSLYFAFPLRSHGHSKCGRDGIRGMSARKGVVFALKGRRKRPQTSHLPVCGEAFAPSGKYLVGISLVSHVPHKAVVRSVEHIVERHSEFHHSEA